MTCPRCHEPMVLILHQTATGLDNREDRKVYRCRECWLDKVVTKPRTRDFTVSRRRVA